MARPADMTPEAARRFFGTARYRTLEQAARVILPAGGAIAAGADEAGVARGVAQLAAGLPRPLQAGLKVLLTTWNLAPLASRYHRRFSQLRVHERAAYVEEAAAGARWRREMLSSLKSLCLMAYTAHPQVGEALGFDGRCVDDSPPRPGPRLQPIAHPEIAGEVTARADVVVVGSGAGGAVVAKELAERGLTVVVVEEGAYFTQADFHGPLLERMQTLYRSSGMTVALGRPAIPVPMGKAVGGTTVINSGTCFRPPDRVLHAWESQWGIPGVAPDAMAAIFEHVERTIHVKPVPEALLGENARVFRRGLEALGLHGQPIQRNIDGCHGCGVCAFGCPSDAKQAMHLSYLPRAEAAGARIYARCRVRRILQENGRAAGVVAEILGSEHGPGTDGHVRGRLTVRASCVVLAAGAVHTPLLLMANGLAARRGPVGRGLRIHPAVGVSGTFDEDLYAWRGTLQSFFMDDFQAEHGLLFEVTSPLPGLSAAGIPGVGAQAKDALAASRKVAAVGLFVAESSAGRVRRLPTDRPLITYQLNQPDTSKLIYGIGVAARVLFAAGARQVNTGIAGLAPLRGPSEIPRLTDRPWKPSSLSVVGFHPCGTARMGRDRQRCAVDPWGESYALPGLYVADASVLPDCVGVNPQVTIMGMATRIAWHLAERLGAGSVSTGRAP
ncbi:MAG: GMC family oxidoreductase N-terminal domain-containing protein [Candidatus Binatia bacterium]